MKKIILYMAAMAAMVSCTKAPIEELTPEVEGAQISVRVELPTSRIAVGEDWGVTWEDRDQLLAVNASDTSTFTMSSINNQVATFDGAIVGDFNLLYPATLNADQGIMALDLTTQTAGARSNYMISSEMIKNTTEVTDVQMKHLCSYLEIQMPHPNFEGTLTSVSLSGFNATCKLDATKSFDSKTSYTEMAKGTITATEGLSDGAIRLNILPTQLAEGDKVQVKAIIKDANNELKTIQQTITVSEAMAFERGMYNTIECTNFEEFGEWTTYAVAPTNNEISTAEELAWLAKSVNSGTITSDGETYTLTADIDLSAHEWVAIGKSTNNCKFQGTFDGAGHTISGLYINKSDASYQALFGYTDGATIKNLSVSGEVTGKSAVAGVVAQAINTTLTNCHSSVKVSGTQSVGGVVGYNNSGTIANCYSSGEVTGTQYVGGIAGINSGSSSNSTNCYSSSKVSGTGNNQKYIGGVVGRNYGTVTNCYWNNDNYTGEGIGEGSAINIAGMSTAEMQSDTFKTTLNTNAYTYNTDNTPATPACTWIWTSGYPTLFFAAQPNNGKFSGGDGIDSTTPYLIASRADLDELAADVNGGTDYADTYFALTNDIDLGGSTNEFTAIGNSSNTFKGTFDGAGHAVSGLYIKQSSADNQALFGYTEGATIKNLSVSGEVTGNSSIGGVVGNDEKSTVINCHSSVKVTGTTNVGGVVGKNNSGTVTNSYSSGEVSGTIDVGGVVGENYKGKVTNCYNSNKVTKTGDNPSNVGGVVGKNDSGRVTSCYYNNNLNSMGVGNGSATIYGMTTAEMQSEDFKTTLNTNKAEYNNTDPAPATPACDWGWESGKYPYHTFGN